MNCDRCGEDIEPQGVLLEFEEPSYYGSMSERIITRRVLSCIWCWRYYVDTKEAKVLVRWP